MWTSSTKIALSRTSSVVSGVRSFSSSRAAADIGNKTMQDLMQEIPPELRIPVAASYSNSGNARKSEGRTRPRRETVSFSSKPSEIQAGKRAERLYKREDGAAGGFGGMMRKEKAASAGSSSSGASSRNEGANRQRERNGPGNQGAARAVRKEGDQSRQQPREKFSRVKPMAAEPPVHQIRLEDYAPQRPRGQDDLFGTTSLLDVDVASMDQVQGQNAEFVGGEQNVPADRDSALHRALLAVGSYSHLSPAPFAQSTGSSTNSIIDPKTNRDTLHHFAVHQADFALARGANVSEGQRGIAKGVIMGRLGVKA